MNIKITTKDFFWSYLGYFFNVGVVVILLPFILKFLPAEEVGLWYTFVSISVLYCAIVFKVFTDLLINNYVAISQMFYHTGYWVIVSNKFPISYIPLTSNPIQ